MYKSLYSPTALSSYELCKSGDAYFFDIPRIKASLSDDMETRLFYYIMVGAHKFEQKTDYPNFWRNVYTEILEFQTQIIPAAHWSRLEHSLETDGSQHLPTSGSCRVVVQPLIDHIMMAESGLYWTHRALLISYPNEHLIAYDIDGLPNHISEMNYKIRHRFEIKFKALANTFQGHIGRNMELSVPFAGVRTFDDFNTLLEAFRFHLSTDDAFWEQNSNTNLQNDLINELHSFLENNKVSHF